VLHNKRPFLGAKKMKNEPFIPREGKHPKSIFFVIPRSTHVHNMGSFEKNYVVVMAITSSFDLKAMKLYTR
jgi:hypothetical protein